METLLSLLSATLPLSYGLAAVNYQVYFVREDEFAQRTATRFLFSIFVVHGAFLLLRAIHLGRPPALGLSSMLTVMAIAVTGVYLYVEKLQRNKFTGAFIVPMVVVLQLFASALSGQPESLPASDLMSSPLFGMHMMVAVLGYTAFAVSAVYALMYLLMYRALKRKKFGLIFDRLPSLDELANMGFWASFLGWIFLSATIGLGVLMSLQAFPDFYTDPKFLATTVVWVVYGGVVLAHFALGWRGARSVYISLAGFAFAVFAIVGSELIWKTFHAFDA